MLTSARHFRISRPLATHFRKATCEEVDCLHHLQGWQTVVPEGSPQAGYIRHQSGRRFKEEKSGDGLVRFVFYPGQSCFRTHQLPTDRVPIFSQEQNGERKVQESDRWFDEFNEHSYRLNRRRKE